MGMVDGASGEAVESQQVAPCGSFMHQVIAVTAKRVPWLQPPCLLKDGPLGGSGSGLQACRLGVGLLAWEGLV
ncbi:hypothetical protein F4813DRAFT_284076 [Daldinia decipiens]|uniref:uncharacterized protein n=1 Tax=Daldinia decipiens TaxID=326647 RepID=UPI0020C58964|nr:uncharacterized protein F4813DRAFT_284076 [Daldinia decipiens]KAI1653056.1 hypothetical protein F4813DRAFT_284076 [Daldinia decipiens]